MTQFTAACSPWGICVERVEVKKENKIKYEIYQLLILCWYYQQSIGNLFERAEVRFWDYSKFWSGAPTVFGWKFVFNGRTLEKHLIHIYGKNTCRWKVSLWRQIWWNRWPLKRKQQGHRHISHNHHHSPLFEILVEQGIQRSSDHSRRRGPVFGENEVSQIFWEWDKVSKQTLNSNYRSIKQYEKLLRGKINEVVRRTNTYFLSELITESTPTVPMNGMADGWMGTNKNGGKSDLGELTDSGRGKGKCS